MKVAVIGAGISGLSAAMRLSEHAEVVVYEGNRYAGGHSNTVDVTLDGVTHPVDTGFLVFNHKTYPELVGLFSELSVPTAPSDMSFAVSVGPHDFEWCGTNLSSLFARPANALSARFWRMLRDVLRFNRQATALATGEAGGAGSLAIGEAGGAAPHAATATGATPISAARSRPPAATRLDEPLGEFLAREGYSDAFRDLYLLPMAAAIWSCPMQRMLAFPLGSFVRFFHNHGLLQIDDRPQWHTVRGGAREYVRRILARLDDVRLGTPVRSVTRVPAAAGGGVVVHADRGPERYDHVVLACHSDQSLRLLSDASDAERAVLGAIPYLPNRAYLHTDTGLMPRRRGAWAAWNYLSDGDTRSPNVSVTYWLNRLQPLPFSTPVMVSLNPLFEPDPRRTLAVFDYEHPMFDQGATLAQQRLAQLQGARDTWFAGAWTGYGFHEDGLRSGLAVARALSARADVPLASDAAQRIAA